MMIKKYKPKPILVYVGLALLCLTGCGSIVDYGTFSGHAMEHTIYDGDLIVIRAVEINEIARGDIVAFNLLDTQGNLTRHMIALPNETVEIRDGQIFINGTLLAEPYTDSEPEDLGPLTLAHTTLQSLAPSIPAP